MIWHWLTLAKFFNKIGNYFYYKHVECVKINQRKKFKSDKIYCKKCASRFGVHQQMILKEKIVYGTQGNKTRKMTEFWHECVRCKAKTKKGYQ